MRTAHKQGAKDFPVVCVGGVTYVALRQLGEHRARGGTLGHRNGTAYAFLDNDPVEGQAVHERITLDLALLHVEAIALGNLLGGGDQAISAARPFGPHSDYVGPHKLLICTIFSDGAGFIECEGSQPYLSSMAATLFKDELSDHWHSS